MHVRRIPTLVALATTSLAVTTLAVGSTTLGASADPAPGSAAGSAAAVDASSYAAGPISLGPDAPLGAAPAILWSEDTTIHLEDGSSFELPDDGYDSVVDLARLDDRIVVTRYDFSDFGAGPRLSIFEADGTQVGWTGLGRSATGQLESNDDVVAFIQRDQVVLVEDDGATWTRHFAPVDPAVEVGALTEGSCVVGCYVYLNGTRGPWVMDSTVGDPELLLAPQFITDVRSTPTRSELLGLHSYDEEAGVLFWGVSDVWDQQVWSQDDYSTDSFSPDDSLVLGLDAYNEGAGSGTMAYLDAATGAAQVKFEHVEGWYVGDRTWEDADHAVVTLYDGNVTSVLLRVGTDGSVERLPSSGTDLRLGA